MVRNLFLVVSALLLSGSQVASQNNLPTKERKLKGSRAVISAKETARDDTSSLPFQETFIGDAQHVGHQQPYKQGHRKLFLSAGWDWLWELLRAILSWIVSASDGHTYCCDPNARPDGLNERPMCFEGSTCCSDGNWACNAGDTSSTCLLVGKVCAATDAPVTVTASPLAPTAVPVLNDPPPVAAPMKKSSKKSKSQTGAGSPSEPSIAPIPLLAPSVAPSIVPSVPFSPVALDSSQSPSSIPASLTP